MEAYANNWGTILARASAISGMAYQSTDEVQNSVLEKVREGLLAAGVYNEATARSAFLGAFSSEGAVPQVAHALWDVITSGHFETSQEK